MAAQGGIRASDWPTRATGLTAIAYLSLLCLALSARWLLWLSWRFFGVSYLFANSKRSPKASATACTFDNCASRPYSMSRTVFGSSGCPRVWPARVPAQPLGLCAPPDVRRDAGR